MTPPKKQSYSSTNLRTPVCSHMIACDGANLVGKNRIEKGMCLKCEEAKTKRSKVTPPKGQNTALSVEERRIDALKEKNKLDLSTPEKWNWNPNPDPRDD